MEDKYLNVCSMNLDNLLCDILVSIEYEQDDLLLVVCNKNNGELKILFNKVSHFNYLDEDFYIKEKLNHSIDCGNIYEVIRNDKKLFIVSTYSHIIEIDAEQFTII